jgi:hypothetical protein
MIALLYCIRGAVRFTSKMAVQKALRMMFGIDFRSFGISLQISYYLLGHVLRFCLFPLMLFDLTEFVFVTVKIGTCAVVAVRVRRH